MRDRVEQFSKKTVLLHWVIALGMIGMLCFGIYISDFLPVKLADGSWNMYRIDQIQLHKSIGVGILVFAVWRVVWRIKNGWPKHAGHYKNIEILLSKIVHWVLILGTIFMPISGLMMSIGGGHEVKFFNLFTLLPIFEKNEVLGNLGHTLHAVSAKILIAAILLHVIGALKHHFMDHDGTLKRMAGKRITPPDQMTG